MEPKIENDLIYPGIVLYTVRNKKADNNVIDLSLVHVPSLFTDRT